MEVDGAEEAGVSKTEGLVEVVLVIWVVSRSEEFSLSLSTEPLEEFSTESSRSDLSTFAASSPIFCEGQPSLFLKPQRPFIKP